jgi:hypothetical protein
LARSDDLHFVAQPIAFLRMQCCGRSRAGHSLSPLSSSLTPCLPDSLTPRLLRSTPRAPRQTATPSGTPSQPPVVATPPPPRPSPAPLATDARGAQRARTRMPTTSILTSPPLSPLALTAAQALALARRRLRPQRPKRPRRCTRTRSGTSWAAGPSRTSSRRRWVGGCVCACGCAAVCLSD